jgi:TetR/AcrR family transcriptional repressor of nem operon
MVERLRGGQREGAIAVDLDPNSMAQFLIANIAGIRIAAQAGSNLATLENLHALALRALR